MEEQKDIIKELETEIQEEKHEEQVRADSIKEDSTTTHTKKHIAIIITIILVLVAILITIVLLTPSQKPEDVLRRLEEVSEPVSLSQEEFGILLNEVSVQRSTPLLSEDPIKRSEEIKNIQSELEVLGNL